MEFLSLKEEENAFTIIEIMVVAFIIGVLTAISVPVFAAQKKTAVKVTLVSDVRNAASEMEKTEIFSKTGYGTDIPDSTKISANNTVEVLADQSSATFYCLQGTNSVYPNIFVYYNSSTRRLITEGTIDASNCGDNDGSKGESYTPGTGNPNTGVAGETVQNTPTATPAPTTPVNPPIIPGPNPSGTPSAGTGNSTAVPPPPGYDDPSRKKYDICHNGNMISPALSGILSGHADHKDDIIPPIPGAFFAGLNWDETGSAIWYNGCDTGADAEVPVPVQTPVPVPTQVPTPTPTPTTTPAPAPAKIPAPAGYNDPKAKKFAICHNGNMISPSLSGVINGHTGHDDDIIPPIPNAFPDGINWDAKGSAIWYANCKGQVR